MARKREDKTELPFTINRNDSRSLLDQVTDGLRTAILGGHYRPGEEIPSTRALCPLLGVSRIVTKAAALRLVAEGYLVSRHGKKTFVRDRGERLWRGHVVFICPDREVGYFQTLFTDEMRNRLNEAGYLFTRAGVRMAPDRTCDFSLLDIALAQSVSLAVVLYDRPAIFRHLAARGIPFVSISETGKCPAKAAGSVFLDFNRAVPGFVASCGAAGVREVAVVRWEKNLCDPSAALAGAGIATRRVNVRPDLSDRLPGVVERAAYETFAKLAATNRIARDAAYFFADDYLARGAFTAMLEAGLKIPGDVRVATWVNSGLGPAFSRPFSRMEIDPLFCGRAVADAIVECLGTGSFPPDLAIGPAWIEGETL